MSRHIASASLLALSGTIALNIAAGELDTRVDSMVEIIMQQSDSSGDTRAMASCLGTSEDKMRSAYQGALKFCLTKYGFEVPDESMLDKCMTSQASKSLSISEAKINQCADKLEAEEQVVQEPDIENMSEAEYQAFVANQRAQASQDIEFVKNLTRAASEGTEGLVTLPIYPGSKMVSHFTSGIQVGDGKTSLPVAMFTSGDPIAKVVDYYAGELSGFEQKALVGGTVIFVKGIAGTMQSAEVFTKMQHSPNVTLSPASEKGGPVSIQITYQKQ